MSPHTVAYILNSVAWALGGALTTLIYQRIAGWYRTSRGRGDYTVTATSYFGTLLVGLTLISTLFALSNRIKADAFQDCQTRVNRSNVDVANTKNAVLFGRDGIFSQIEDVLRHPTGKSNKDLIDIIDRGRAYNASHPSQPIDNCQITTK